MDFPNRNQQPHGTRGFDNTSRPHPGDNSFDPRRPIEKKSLTDGGRPIEKKSLTDVGRDYKAFALQPRHPEPVSSSSSSINLHDSASVRAALESERADSEASSEWTKVIKLHANLPPLDDKTTKSIKDHLHKDRSHALPSFSLGYDFDNIKPVNATIEQVNKSLVEDLAWNSWPVTPDTTTESHTTTTESQDSQPQSGSVPGFSRKQQQEIEKWLKQ